MPLAHSAPMPRRERRIALPDEAATLRFGACLAQALQLARGRAPVASATDSKPHAKTPNAVPGVGPAGMLSGGATSLEPFPGLQVQLSGELGAGKTTLVRALLRALGHVGRVRSPTYTLVESYTLGGAGALLPVHHFDLYRFADPAEWQEAGFRDYFGTGALCLIEWPERAAERLGAPDLMLSLEPLGEGRLLTAQAFSEIAMHCLDRC